MVVANSMYQEDSVQILIDFLEPYINITNRKNLASISMVPSVLRDCSPDSYNPRVVSIGPLHHKDVNLVVNEGLKRICVNDLLHPFGSLIEQTLGACLSKVNASVHKIRACYVGINPDISDHELARMMVIDCCFILGFSYLNKYVNRLLLVKICIDLLLVENQIPFFVLKDIFECTILKSKPTACLTDYIHPILFYGNRMLFKRDITHDKVRAHVTLDHDHDHILGILHKCYQQTETIPQETNSSTMRKSIPQETNSSTMRSVVELENAGVSFKPNQDTSWPMTVKFERPRFERFFWIWVKPTLRMPILKIQDDTELFLRNIIAYEQTSKVHQHVTSYAGAIDDLVDSPHDIAKLVKSEVIINKLGSNEEAANMINNICKNIIVDNFYSKQWEELETYYNGYWPRNIAWLKRTYFNSPWNIIALLAGIILFTLTVVQTYLTLYPKK